MVGLSVVLEAHKNGSSTTTTTATRSSGKTIIPLVINKATMIKPSPDHHRHPPPPPPLVSPTAAAAAGSFHHHPPPPVADGFLDACFLCRQKLLPGKDIYMYKGDRAFCTEECRWKQMLMDEEDNTSGSNFTRRKDKANNNCSLAAMKPISPTASSTARQHHQNHRRATRSPAAGGFAR